MNTAAAALPRRVEGPELAALLAQVPQWRAGTERGGLLAREFVFRDFAQAFGFMAQVAVFADRRDHHPEWSNVYNRVAVTLTTHDAGGLSPRDFELARFMDQVAGALATQSA